MFCSSWLCVCFPRSSAMNIGDQFSPPARLQPQQQCPASCASSRKRRRRKAINHSSSSHHHSPSRLLLMVVVVLACVVGSLGQPFPWQQSVNNITASDKCGGLGSCADCVKTSLGCSWCGSLGRCLSPGDQTNCPEAPYAGSMLGCAALPTSPDDARCRALPICGNCVR